MQWWERMEWKSQAALLYADDVCLMASSEEDMKVIVEKVKACVVEYGFKVNEKKSKVLCINGITIQTENTTNIPTDPTTNIKTTTRGNNKIGLQA